VDCIEVLLRATTDAHGLGDKGAGFLATTTLAVHAPNVGIDDAAFGHGPTGGTCCLDQGPVVDEAQILVANGALPGDELRFGEASGFLLGEFLRNWGLFRLQEVIRDWAPGWRGSIRGMLLPGDCNHELSSSEPLELNRC
jgi:hypothetical protein